MKKRKPYQPQDKWHGPMRQPKRLRLGEIIHTIICEESAVELTKINPSFSNIAGRSTERVLKIVQNNYRRRKY